MPGRAVQALGERCEFASKICRRIVTAPRGVGEADEIGQRIVTEKTIQTRVVEPVRSIEVAVIKGARRLTGEKA